VQPLREGPASSTRRTAPPLLPTPSKPPRIHAAPTESQRKRARRRRNRRVLYKDSRTWCSVIPKCGCDRMAGSLKKVTRLASVSPQSWSGMSGTITCSTAWLQNRARHPQGVPNKGTRRLHRHFLHRLPNWTASK
jgi:hypothetical protein